MTVRLNEVSLDFHETDRDIAPQHYAFLVSENDARLPGVTRSSIVRWVVAPVQSGQRPGIHCPNGPVHGGAGIHQEVGDQGSIMLYPLVGAWTRLSS
jgi:hypothetical protein